MFSHWRGIQRGVILSCDDHPLVRKLHRGVDVHQVEKVYHCRNSRPGTKPRHRWR